MSQITIYVPKDLEAKIRERAATEGKSISAFMAALAAEVVEPDAWSQAFLELYGSWEGELEEPVDPPPETRDEL